MFAFPVWEFLLEILLKFAGCIVVIFLIAGIMRLYVTIFYGE